MMVLGAISSHSIAATIRTGLVLATVCITCFHLSCSRTHAPERTPAVQLTRHLHLIPLLKENTPTIQGAQPLHPVKVEISEDRRMALLQAPPGSHVFTDLPSGPGKTLHTALGLLPKAWSAGSDGARFILSCTDPAKSSLTLTDVTIDHPQDWRKVAVELDQCSMPTTDLTFQTMCGSHGDCNWDWAAWASPEIEYEQFQTFRPKRLVLLISIDTLRADRLGLYGSDRATSTNLDHLAHDAVVFDKAYAPSPWTLPSHASLLTSTWPISSRRQPGTRPPRRPSPDSGDIQRRRLAMCRFLRRGLARTRLRFRQRIRHFSWPDICPQVQPWRWNLQGEDHRLAHHGG